MSDHAILSPSSADRWLTCTKSARLEQKFPSTDSEYAKEGTLAHTLGELLIRMHLGLIKEAEYYLLLETVENNPLYDPSMMDHAEAYAAFILEKFTAAKVHTSDALLFLEQRLNLTEYIPEGFGTGDAVIIADKVLDLTDLKYGKGVSVSAIENKQMMLYGLGALHELEYLFDIDTVRMTIYQPRIDNYSTWEISVADLKKWAKEELIPIARKAFEGKGEFVPGDHCRFCRAKVNCKAFAEMNLQLAVYDFEDATLLSDADITDILSRADQFTNWLKAIEEHALDQAVNSGKKWPGYKLVEGRSNRKYADEEAIAKRLIKWNFKENQIYNIKLIGLTEMQKVIGKKNFDSISDLIIKPPGKPTLVSTDDKRPEYNSLEAAQKDFA